MKTKGLTKVAMTSLLVCLSCRASAQASTQLVIGDNELVKGNYYEFPTIDAEARSAVPQDAIYYLPDFFEKDDKGYKFLGESGLYAIATYRKEYGFGDKNYYMQIWPRDKEAQGNDEYYAHLDKNFGAIWVSGEGAGLPSYQNYNDPWNAWDTFAMTQTSPKIYEMTLTLGKELGPNASVKFWFYNFSQNRYRIGDTASGKAEYGIPDGSGNWDNASHEYEFRGNKWNNDDFVPLLKMEEKCDFMKVSKHTAEHDAQGGEAAKPQYGNGNMGGISVGNYSDLPNLPVSTDKHTYKYKFTIDLQGVNDIKQDHKGEPDFAYDIKIENKGDAYGLTNYDVNTYDDLTLDTEDNNGQHAISLRDAMRFQGGVLYKDHFNKKFQKLTITGYLNQNQDIAFLRDIANNIKVLDLSGVTGIEENQIPADFSANNSTLEELILPACLQTIGANAFAGCSHLKKIYVKGNSAATGANASAFHDVNANQCELVFEDGADGNQYRQGGWMNILTKDIYENANREEGQNYNVCHQAHADVRLHRQFTGKWETIVLPFDVTKEQILTKERNIDHASVFRGYQENGDRINISFLNIHHETTTDSQYDHLSAGHPFLLRIKDGYTSPINDVHTYENVETKTIEDLADQTANSSTINGLTFIGTYNATPKDRDKLNDIFALKNGLFYHATNASMKGYRAWFVKESPTQNAKALAFTEVDENNSTTAIIGIEKDGSFSEAFDIYNVNGQLIQKDATSTAALPAGIYIINHKKIVIK